MVIAWGTGNYRILIASLSHPVACSIALAWSGMGLACHTLQPAYNLPPGMDLGGCVCVTPSTSHPKRKSVILHLYQLGV